MATVEKKSITKEEIQKLPILQYSGEVLLINQQSQVQDTVDQLLTRSVLGFDTETRPAFKKGEFYLPSLLQLATEDQVFVFQLQLLEDLSVLFNNILGNKDLVKAGVAIHDDLIGLKKLYPFKEKGFIEIAQLADQHNLTNRGLRGLAALTLGGRISKSEQTSNWANKRLTKKQLTYAATDAWVSRQIFQKLS